ncbi:MAG: aminopeptidase P family N-terminal domain-containing protein [Deinococcales bacterium]
MKEAFSKLGAQALIVTYPANVRYLSGFSSPKDGRVLITEDKALLFTDGRYTAQVKEEGGSSRQSNATGKMPCSKPT